MNHLKALVLKISNTGGDTLVNCAIGTLVAISFIILWVKAGFIPMVTVIGLIVVLSLVSGCALAILTILFSWIWSRLVKWAKGSA